VTKFKSEREFDGLKFGPIHARANFEFANAKDSAGNSIQISNRRPPGLKHTVSRSGVSPPNK
jgi:hypothetical protein